MYKSIGIELQNRITKEICEVYISDGRCRWTFPDDYILHHNDGKWSFLCSENGFRRVINYDEWGYYKGAVC